MLKKIKRKRTWVTVKLATTNNHAPDYLPTYVAALGKEQGAIREHKRNHDRKRRIATGEGEKQVDCVERGFSWIS